MKVRINLNEWRIKEVDGDKKICGEFEIKAGATVIAKQAFNDGWNNTKVPFSPELMIKVNALTAEIERELTKNFVGEEKEAA